MSFLKRILASEDQEKFEDKFELEVEGKLPGIDFKYTLPHDFKLEMKYEAKFDFRSWGIDGIHFYVPEQEIEFTVLNEEEEDEDKPASEHEIKLKVGGSGVKTLIEINHDADPERSSISINPTTVKIIDGKIAEVIFKI